MAGGSRVLITSGEVRGVGLRAGRFVEAGP